MSRWIARILGLVLLLVMAMLFVHLHSQLTELQRARSETVGGK